ncbi:MAG: hypothetical protein ABI721_04475 [Candidatus Dojkabacteria bacterium]
MNKQWKYLIYAGIVILIAAIAWEVFESASGDREEFSLIVLDMPKTTLFTKSLENHLNAGTVPVSFPQ